MRNGLKFAVAFYAFAGACSKSPPPREAAVAAPYAEDEFAARAAALQKTCELAVVYLGTDDARAAAVVEQGRREALEAVRRAPDPYRGVVPGEAGRQLEHRIHRPIDRRGDQRYGELHVIRARVQGGRH